MVDDCLEHRGFKQGHNTVGGHDVPNDARAVLRGRNSLRVGSVDADISDATSVLFERGSHNLSLVADLPDTDLAFHAAGNDARAVVGWRQSSNAVVVGVVDSVEEST